MTTNNTGIKPPEVPTVDRKTGRVSPTAEYPLLDQPQLDGWEFSDERDTTFLMGPDYLRNPDASKAKDKIAIP